jgi:two-component system, OmpR family, response regulator
MTATALKPRILVVDDNKDAATTLGILLANSGYHVETCFDGCSALATAERFDPDACVLDINMPGMDGYELARRLRAKRPDRPPVFATVTAYEDYKHLETAADVGFDLHFTKPADPGDVAEQLADEMRKRDAARADRGLTETVIEGAAPITDMPADEELRPAVRDGRAGSWLLPAGAGFVVLVVLGLLIRQLV